MFPFHDSTSRGFVPNHRVSSNFYYPNSFKTWALFELLWPASETKVSAMDAYFATENFMVARSTLQQLMYVLLWIVFGGLSLIRKLSQ